MDIIGYFETAKVNSLDINTVSADFGERPSTIMKKIRWSPYFTREGDTLTYYPNKITAGLKEVYAPDGITREYTGFSALYAYLESGGDRSNYSAYVKFCEPLKGETSSFAVVQEWEPVEPIRQGQNYWTACNQLFKRYGHLIG